MKIIPKMQRGGGFDQFFTTYTPSQEYPRTAPQRQPSRVSRESEERDKGKLTEKDFFSMLQDIDGLQNEREQIITNLINTINIDRILGMELSDLSTTYLQNLYKVKQAKDNKKHYDETYKRAIDSGSLTEPAITADGRVLVQDQDGNIKKVSLKQLVSNGDEYAGILSVSDILKIRAQSPSFVNDTTLLDAADTSVGYQSFQKLVKEAANTLGGTYISKEGMFSVDGQASKGLELLKTLQQADKDQLAGSITSEGLYEYKIIDKNQKNQIDALTRYICALLPENAKIWAAIKLGEPDKEKATASLITTYLASGEDLRHEVTINRQNLPSASKTSKSSEGKSSVEEPDMTFLTAIQNGYGGSYERRRYNIGGNGTFSVTGTTYGAFIDQKGNVISDSTLQGLLSQTGLAGIANVNSVTFGDNIIKPSQMPFVAIQNTGGVRAILPCKRNGTLVTPDFDLMESYDKLVQEVNRELGSSATYEQRELALQNKVRQHPELQELLDVTGKLDYNKFCAFVIVDGLASDLNFTFKSRNGEDISSTQNPLIHRTDDDNDSRYFSTVTQEKLNDNIFKDIFGSGINKDILYKSAIFIPINTNNRLSGVLFSGQKIKDSSALGLEQEYQTSFGAQELNSSNPLLLLQ